MIKIDADIKKSGILKGKVTLTFKDDPSLYHFIKEMERIKEENPNISYIFRDINGNINNNFTISD